MISIDKEVDIKFLLEEGLSQNEISKRTGVSRSTIRLIAKAPKIRSRPEPKAVRKFIKLKKKRKCKICGGYVILWPCVLCSI